MDEKELNELLTRNPGLKDDMQSFGFEARTPAEQNAFLDGWFIGFTRALKEWRKDIQAESEKLSGKLTHIREVYENEKP